MIYPYNINFILDAYNHVQVTPLNVHNLLVITTVTPFSIYYLRLWNCLPIDIATTNNFHE